MPKLLCALVLMASACSSSSGSSSSDVPAKCNEVANSICSSNANCAVETAQIAADQSPAFIANCVSGFKTSIDCSRQTKITGNPGVCE